MPEPKPRELSENQLAAWLLYEQAVDPVDAAGVIAALRAVPVMAVEVATRTDQQHRITGPYPGGHYQVDRLVRSA